MGSLSKRGLGVEPCLRVTEAEESGLLKPEKKFPGRPVVLLPLPRAQVQSPVEELRSCVSCDEAKKKKKSGTGEVGTSGARIHLKGS